MPTSPAAARQKISSSAGKPTASPSAQKQSTGLCFRFHLRPPSTTGPPVAAVHPPCPLPLPSITPKTFHLPSTSGPLLAAARFPRQSILQEMQETSTSASASAPRMDLGGLPGELLTEIARRLPCPADLVALTAALRRPIAPPAPRPALPWLLVPHPSPPVLAPGEARTAMFVCIGCGGPHHLRVPEEFAAGRFFGSYPPGWVFLAGAQASDHALINLYTGTRLLIPDFLTMTGDATCQPRRMVMVAAALSAETGKVCFGAAIVGTPCDPDINNDGPVFALWVLNRSARDERPVAHGFHVDVGAGAGHQLFLEDVAYHGGAFYFLTSQEQLVAVHVVEGGGGLLARQQLIEHRRPAPANPQGLLVSGRYLLASRGGWAMVVRYHWPALPGDREPGPARRFTMYRGEIHHGDAFTTWMELQPESLQGLLVFAARGCSSFIEDPSGLHNLLAGVRYLDDRDARDLDMIQEDPSLREYRCSDTCGFGWPPAAIHFYATWVNYPPSTYSSPIWFFP